MITIISFFKHILLLRTIISFFKHILLMITDPTPAESDPNFLQTLLVSRMQTYHKQQHHCLCSQNKFIVPTNNTGMQSTLTQSKQKKSHEPKHTTRRKAKLNDLNEQPLLPISQSQSKLASSDIYQTQECTAHCAKTI